ncbi:MAG: hypothetical protein EXS05_12370 [Planctomycetaceae bacterium]|nr:hypothetical protein [Planctomycetaceae bacterium]
MTRSQSVQLREYVATDTTGHVDRESGIITNVKVLGRISKNDREYSDAALNDVTRLAENAPVFIDHPARDRRGDRSVRDRIGFLERVHRTSDGVRGDLHFLRSHPLAEQLCESAERMPHQIGLSINADGSMKRIGGENVVEAVESLRSVDLVYNPATNAGLFESTILEDGCLLPPDPEMDGADDDDGDTGSDFEARLSAIERAVFGDATAATESCNRFVESLCESKPSAERITRFVESLRDTPGPKMRSVAVTSKRGVSLAEQFARIDRQSDYFDRRRESVPLAEVATPTDYPNSLKSFVDSLR